MLDNLGIVASSLCLLLGAVLLYVGVSKADTNQILIVLGGAAVLSLGLITVWLAVKNKLEWRRNYKKYREGLWGVSELRTTRLENVIAWAGNFIALVGLAVFLWRLLRL